jgi:hypothetical protein
MEVGQQQQHINPSVLYSIARISDPRFREVRHMLWVGGSNQTPFLDRRSLQHVVHYLAERPKVTELELHCIQLSYPSDGGLQVLRTFFSRSDTTLTKVTLNHCTFRQPRRRHAAFSSLSHESHRHGFEISSKQQSARRCCTW